MQDINRLIEISDYPDWWLFVRVGMYEKRGRDDLALADLNVLIDKNETRDEYIFQTHQKIEELKKAGKRCGIDDLVSDSLNLMVMYRFALRRKTEILVKAGDWEAAVATLGLMIEDDPDDVDHLRKRGIILEELGRPKDALASYDQAIRLIETEEADRSDAENGYAEAYGYRATIHQSQHRVVQARLDFDNALKLGDAAFVQAFQLRMQKAGHFKGPLNGIYDGVTKDAMHRCASDIRCVDPEV